MLNDDWYLGTVAIDVKADARHIVGYSTPKQPKDLLHIIVLQRSLKHSSRQPK